MSPFLILITISLPDFTKKQFLGTVEDVRRSAEQDYETFIRLADGFSLREEKARKLKWIIRPAAKTVNHLTFGKIWRLSGPRRCGVTKREISSVKDKPVVPFVLDMAANLYRGDAALDKRSVEYRVACGFFRLCDAMAKPFSAKLRSVGIDSVSEVLLPLLHNDGIPDAEYVICIDRQKTE